MHLGATAQAPGSPSASTTEAPRIPEEPIVKGGKKFKREMADPSAQLYMLDPDLLAKRLGAGALLELSRAAHAENWT